MGRRIMGVSAHRPELLLAFDPCKRYGCTPITSPQAEPRWMRASWAMMPRCYPNVGEHAWVIGELWLFNADAPNHFVDVSKRIDLRKRALALHRSQTRV